MVYLYFVRCKYGGIRSKDGWIDLLLKAFSPSYGHVLVGDDDVTLNPLLRGNEFWPTAAITTYPDLAGAFVVPTLPPVWRIYEGVPRRSGWTYARRLCGLYDHNADCVTTAAHVLGRGLDAITPDELWKYLEGEGYEWQTVAELRDNYVARLSENS